MNTNQPKKRSLIAKIIGVLVSFLPSRKTNTNTSDMQSEGSMRPTMHGNTGQVQNTSTSNSTPTDSIRNDQPQDASTQLEEAGIDTNSLQKVNQATFKYGQQVITLSKSKQFLAIKKKEEASETLAGGIMPRQAAPPSSSENKLGDFELVQPIQPSLDNVETTLDSLRNLPSTAIGTHVFHYTNQTDDAPLIPSGELYLLFKEEAPLQKIRKTLDELHLHVLEERTQREMVVEVTEKSPNPIKCTIQLQKSSLIDIAEPDLITRIELASFHMPQDELLKEQWHLQNTGEHGEWSKNLFKEGADAKVVEAWKYMNGHGSDDIIIAFTDNGFDLDHPDLKGNGTKIVHPWDFQSNTDDPSPRDGDWHGTPCAAVALAAINGEGTVGVAPNSKFMPIRTYYISDSQIEKWFDYVRDKGAAIMSNSWGAPSASFTLSTRMIKAITRCATEGRNGKGCIICFAAGNNNRSISDANAPNRIMGFATHPNVITVAGSTSKDERATYSNFGKQISVAAPTNGDGGAGVTTADVSGNMDLMSGDRAFRGYEDGDYTSSFGGTSSACPVVAGICALVLSVNPKLSAAQVKKLIQDTSDRIGKEEDYDENGHSIYYGYGRVNALAAVKKAQEMKDAGVPENDPTDTETDASILLPPIDIPNLGFPTPDIQSLSFMAIHENKFLGGEQEHFYRISLSRQLVIKLDGAETEGKSDFDIYLRKKEMPTVQNYNYKSNDWGTKETIIVRQPSQEDFYVLVNAHQGNGGYNLEAMLTPPSQIAEEGLILRAQGAGLLIQGQASSAAFKLSRHKRLRFELIGDDQYNFDLYVKRGARPAWDDFDKRSASADSTESVVIDEPDMGDYYILVRARVGSGAYQLVVTAE